MFIARNGHRIVLALTFSLPLLAATSAVAKNWNTTDGNWNTAANWSPASVPVASEQVNIVNSDGIARTVTLDVNTPSLGLVTINQTGGTAVNTLSIPNNNTFTSGALFVAGWTGGAGGSTTNGRGAVSQSNGSVTMASGTDLVVGFGAGSVGTYTLSGTGSLTASQSEFIGSIGTGTFTQSAGTNTLLASAVGYLNMGTSAGGTGTYNLSGGTLIANKNEIVGDAGTGIFNQTGGTNAVQGAGNDVVLGNAATGNGTYTISNDASLTVADDLIVGASGVGTLNVQGNSSVYVSDALTINSSSNVNLNGGTLRFNSIGGTGGLSRLHFNSGTIQLSGNREFFSPDNLLANLLGFPRAIPVNKGLYVEGEFNLRDASNGDSLFVGGGKLTAGDMNVDRGAVNISDGGTVKTFADSFVGLWPDQYDSAVNISGPGSTWEVGGDLFVGGNSRAVVNISSGALVYVHGQLSGSTPNVSSTSGIFNLNGGTLRFNGFLFAPDWFNFYSGTIQLSGDRLLGNDVTINSLFGAAPTISTQKWLTVDGVANLQAPTTIDGGTLSVGQLVNGQFLRFLRGTLNINDQAVSIASNGVLGSTLDLNNEMIVNVSLGISNQGLVTGDGEIGGTFTNAAAGELRGEPGKSLKLTGANNTNSGQINLYGGMVEFTQNLTNNSGGFISGNGTIKTNALTNNGIMNFSGLANIVGDVTNNAGAKIISSGGGPTTFHDDVINNGEIRTSAGSFTTFFGAASGSGTYTGTGTVNFEGDLKPGSSPAAVSFGGDVVLGPASILTMEIGGIAAGSQHDQINVAGKLTLDGTLQLSLINGFVPTPGQTFDLLNWGTVAGTFAALQLPSLPGLTWNTSQLSSGIVSVAAAGVAGDYNNNGTVDAGDYILWRKYQGTTHALPNDPTGGMIGAAQYATWRSHFGQPPGSGSGSAAGLDGPTVPEPASSTLLMMTVLVMFLVRRFAET